MKTICVLFGGRSSEYDVSLSSAFAVLSNIDRSAYDLLCIGITRDGRWYRFDGPVDEIRSGAWCAHPETLPTVSLDLTDGRIRCISPDGTVTETVCDAVFPVLHGKYGEDGTVQGLFAVAGIPVVGCGCTSSGVCMDKAFTNPWLPRTPASGRQKPLSDAGKTKPIWMASGKNAKRRSDTPCL